MNQLQAGAMGTIVAVQNSTLDINTNNNNSSANVNANANMNTNMNVTSRNSGGII